MPLIALSSTQLNVVRAHEGEPLLLIQGMGGTHLSWGEDVPRRPRRRPRAHQLRPPQHRSLGARRRRAQHRAARRRRRRAARRARARPRPRRGDLDGRHGRPGARAAPSRAGAQPDPRVHVARRRGGRATRSRALARDARGPGLRRPRAGAARELRDEPVGGLDRRRGALRALPADGPRAARRARGHGPPAAGGDGLRRRGAPAARSRRRRSSCTGPRTASCRPRTASCWRAGSPARAWSGSTAPGTCSGGSSRERSAELVRAHVLGDGA